MTVSPETFFFRHSQRRILNLTSISPRQFSRDYDHKGDIIRSVSRHYSQIPWSPPMSSPDSITKLLIEWRDGDETALNRLIPLVYEELHRMAHRHMRRERQEHTLQTTALINEAYLRLVDHKGMRWQNRAHFYGVAAQAMRRVLVDEARTRGSNKRKHDRIDLKEAALVAPQHAPDLIALDEALNELAAIDPRKSQVVVMKYFGGMKDKEIAHALGISSATVTRDWSSAKLWLLKSMNPQAEKGTSSDLNRP